MIIKVVQRITTPTLVKVKEATYTVSPFDQAVGAVKKSIFTDAVQLLVSTGAGQVDVLSAAAVPNGYGLVRDSNAPLGLGFSAPAGGIADHTICNGRLTLESGVPVSTTDQSGKKIVYFTPYRGNLIGLYYQGAWSRYNFTEKQIKVEDAQTGTLTAGSAVVTGLSDTSQLIVGMAVSGTGVPASTTILSVDSSTQITMSQNATASGAQSLTFQIPAGKLVDIFAFYTGAAVKLEFGPLWTNSTTRATGLTLQDGILVKNGDATRRYLGTVCALSGTAGQTSDAKGMRLLWNYHNRVPFKDYRPETLDSWTDAGNTVWSATANGSAVWKQEFVIGLDEYPMEALSEITSEGVYIHAVALDGTTFDRTKSTLALTVSGGYGTTISHFAAHCGIGYHYLQGIETTPSDTARTAYGDAGGILTSTPAQSGFTVYGWR